MTWEYKRVVLAVGGLLTDSGMNDIAASGWEMVTLVYEDEFEGVKPTGRRKAVYIFKRPKVQKVEAS